MMNSILSRIQHLLRKNSFARKDEGAVTVDWVVLTAVIVGLAFPLLGMIYGANNVLAGKASTAIENAPMY